jgi:FixJ family two-component response regulator
LNHIRPSIALQKSLANSQLGYGTSFDLMDAIAGQLVIIVAGAGDEDMAVQAMRQGAYDFLSKDVAQGYLKLLPCRVEMALAHVQRTRALHDLVEDKTALL